MTDETEIRQRREILATNEQARLERMLEIRTCEDRIHELFAAGEVRGTTHLCQGQEAVSVGLASVTTPEDAVTCTYRGHGTAMATGLRPSDVIGEVMGKTIGCIQGLGGSMHMSAPSVGLLPSFAIVGAGLPVAVGAALTARAQGTDQVAVAVFGDGATNIGAFHEALNLASIWKLPVVFVCENNLYGEYSPIGTTTPIVDLARRADSYGMPGVIADGQSLQDVMGVVGDAVARARDGGGPTLVEAKTYRFGGHSRSDTAPYRPEGELEEWKKRDPIVIERQRLADAGQLSDADWDELSDRVVRSIDDAVDAARSAAEPDPRLLFEFV